MTAAVSADSAREPTPEIPEADAAETIPAAEGPDRDLRAEADAEAVIPAAEDPDRAEREHVPDRDPQVRAAAETRAASSLIRIRTADPEKTSSITRKRIPAGTNRDASTAPRRRSRFPLKNRSRQSPFPRKSLSATWRSACIFRQLRSSRNSSCRAR